MWETSYKNAKGEGREPLAQLIDLASNALLVQPDLLVRRTTKNEEKEGSDGQEGTNYSQGSGDSHACSIDRSYQCAEELKTLTMNDQ